MTSSLQHGSFISMAENADAANGLYMSELHLNKLYDHAFSIDYSTAGYDENAGIDYIRSHFHPVGACSSVQNGLIRGRNLDWNFVDQCVFVIRTAAIEGRHATIGVASGSSILKQELVDGGRYAEIYRYLPYYTSDGMNDAGLIININVTPANDYAPTTGTNPAKEPFPLLCLPRYLLDHAADVTEAITIASGLNLQAMHTELLSEEFHFMVSDATGHTVIFEFDGNAMHVVEGNTSNPYQYDTNILTNFNLLHPWEKHAQGVERYRLLKENYSLGDDSDGMLELMKLAWYHQCYTIPPTDDRFWWTEYNLDSTGCTWDDIGNVSKYQGMYERQHERYMKGERNELLWFTVHTAVYDWNAKSLLFAPQEYDIPPFRFSL